MPRYETWDGCVPGAPTFDPASGPVELANARGAAARAFEPLLHGDLLTAIARKVKQLTPGQPADCTGRAQGSQKCVSGVERELDAITAYAQFIARYPDMPDDHRAKFLAHIERCTDAVRGRVC